MSGDSNIALPESVRKQVEVLGFSLFKDRPWHYDGPATAKRVDDGQSKEQQKAASDIQNALNQVSEALTLVHPGTTQYSNLAAQRDMLNDMATQLHNGRVSPAMVQMAVTNAAAAATMVTNGAVLSNAVHMAMDGRNFSSEQIAKMEQEYYAKDPIYRQAADKLLKEADAAHDESKKKEKEYTSLASEMGVDVSKEQEKLGELEQQRAAAMARHDVAGVADIDVKIAEEHKAITEKNKAAAEQPGHEQYRGQAAQASKDADEELKAAIARKQEAYKELAAAADRSGDHTAAKALRDDAAKALKTDEAAARGAKPEDRATLKASLQTTAKNMEQRLDHDEKVASGLNTRDKAIAEGSPKPTIQFASFDTAIADLSAMPGADLVASTNQTTPPDSTKGTPDTLTDQAKTKATEAAKALAGTSESPKDIAKGEEPQGHKVQGVQGPQNKGQQALI